MSSTKAINSLFFSGIQHSISVATFKSEHLHRVLYPSLSYTFPIYYHHFTNSALPFACRAHTNAVCHIAQLWFCTLSICTNKKCTKKAVNRDTAAGPTSTWFISTILSGTAGISRTRLKLTAMDKPFSSGSLSHPSLRCCVIMQSNLILPRFLALWIIAISNKYKLYIG